MSLMYLTLADGRKLPVGTGVMPVCTFDDDGKPVAVAIGGGGSAEGATEATLDDFRKRAFGLRGGVYVTDSTPQVGSFVAIMALEEAVIASMAATDIAGSLEDILLPAGVTIYGTITAFELTSGKVIAYKG